MKYKKPYKTYKHVLLPHWPQLNDPDQRYLGTLIMLPKGDYVGTYDVYLDLSRTALPGDERPRVIIVYGGGSESYRFAISDKSKPGYGWAASHPTEYVIESVLLL